jgi:hypothetical protein
MRLYMLFLVFMCSLSLSAQAAKKDDLVEFDSLDYFSMFRSSQSLLLETCGDRLGAILEQKEESAVLKPANDEEFRCMMFSIFTYYVGLMRLKQEIACLRNPQEADEALEAVLAWHTVLSCLPAQLFDVAIECFKKWSENEIDRSWKPQDTDVALYKSSSEWPALRRKAALDFIKMLDEVA